MKQVLIDPANGQTGKAICNNCFTPKNLFSRSIYSLTMLEIITGSINGVEFIIWVALFQANFSLKYKNCQKKEEIVLYLLPKGVYSLFGVPGNNFAFCVPKPKNDYSCLKPSFPRLSKLDTKVEWKYWKMI